MKMDTELNFEKNLSPQQLEIVDSTEGPILIVAGAGSGKTRVITYKIAYLILNKNVSPNRILTLTFTNKAANEMIERLKDFKTLNYNGLWIGTFHSIFCRILRQEAKSAGYKSNFYIYDEDDQINVIKEIMEKFNYKDSSILPKTVYRKIDFAKNHLIKPEEYIVNDDDKYNAIVKNIFFEYEKYLRNHNAFDFNDLLIKPINMFNENPNILKKYQNRFKYILVDEFQDTNLAQYQLLRLISQKHNNICVVGDDDQSIYGWRGAEITNILNFEKDYPDTKIFKLEQNYRSTKNILEMAQSIIRYNKNRRDKNLWTLKESGEKINVKVLKDEKEESLWIAQNIKIEIYRGKKKLCNFAVLLRTNAQSRVIEEGLYKESIPYTFVGGTRFYDKAEVKDILAYLRVIANSDDELSLKRIINYPPRGIGEATIKKIEEISKGKKLGFFENIKLGIDLDTIPERNRKSLENFYDLIEKYKSLKKKISLTELVRALVDEIGIIEIFKREGTVESLSRLENVMELLSIISEYLKQSDNEGLEGFIEKVSLLNDIDNWSSKQEVVTLMTLHNAKGLEFSTVFIPGLEEGLFPIYTRMNNISEIEEERRLFYVGATRALDKLFLSYALKRMRLGEIKKSDCSRFLNEVDKNYIEGEILLPIYEEREKKKSYVTHPMEKKYSIGKEVFHEMFGSGRIIYIEGKGDSMKISVDFEAVGIKKLRVKYANLKVLN